MNFMPRFDIMRAHIDSLRSRYKQDGKFFHAVLDSAYGIGFYREHALNYARTLLQQEA